MGLACLNNSPQNTASNNLLPLQQRRQSSAARRPRTPRGPNASCRRPSQSCASSLSSASLASVRAPSAPSLARGTHEPPCPRPSETTKRKTQFESHGSSWRLWSSILKTTSEALCHEIKKRISKNNKTATCQLGPRLKHYTILRLLETKTNVYSWGDRLWASSMERYEETYARKLDMQNTCIAENSTSRMPNRQRNIQVWELKKKKKLSGKNDRRYLLEHENESNPWDIV